MEFQQLEIFVQVASLKSFSRAAENLFISQPAVSSRIKALEHALGVVLFDRNHPEGLALTGEGRKLLDYAQEMINIKNRALSDFGEENETGDLLHIGASTVPGCYLLPGALAEYKKTNPLANITLTIKDTYEVVKGILNYDFQIGVVGSPGEETVLTYEKLEEDRLIFIAPVGCELSREYSPGSLVPLESCFHQELLLREPGSATRKVLENAVKEKGYSINHFRRLIYFNSLEGVKQGVRFGLGCSVVSLKSVEDYLETGKVNHYYIKDLELGRSFYLVFHSNRVQSSKSWDFLYFLKSYFNRGALEQVEKMDD